MQYRPSGRTDLRVSVICLGAMTFGERNSGRDAHRQLDAAVNAGVNLIDTVEMYTAPSRAETCRLGYRHADEEQAAPIEQTLRAPGGLAKAGKIRPLDVLYQRHWVMTMCLRHKPWYHSSYLCEAILPVRLVCR